MQTCGLPLAPLGLPTHAWSTLLSSSHQAHQLIDSAAGVTITAGVTMVVTSDHQRDAFHCAVVTANLAAHTVCVGAGSTYTMYTDAGAGHMHVPNHIVNSTLQICQHIERCQQGQPVTCDVVVNTSEW
jgi:hypothetical protein